jgi:aspartate-semialdehyde dehydrogenase
VLARPALRVFATAVRIPTFFGLGIAATVETDRPVAGADVHAWLRVAPGLLLANGDGDPYVTLLDAVGTDVVHVGRVRVDADCPTTFGLWLAMDGIRKGAAVNAVAIAERMLRTAA